MTGREHPDMLQVKKRTKLHGTGKPSVLLGIKDWLEFLCLEKDWKNYGQNVWIFTETTDPMQTYLLFLRNIFGHTSVLMCCLPQTAYKLSAWPNSS